MVNGRRLGPRREQVEGGPGRPGPLSSPKGPASRRRRALVLPPAFALGLALGLVGLAGRPALAAQVAVEVEGVFEIA